MRIMPEEKWPTPPPLDEASAKRRRGRNIALFVVLALVALLFYAIAMVKMAQHGSPG